MMKFTSILLADPRFIARDNEGEGADADAGDSTASDDANEIVGTPSQDGNVTFTQDQLNEIVVKRNKKVRQQLETAEATVEKLLKTQNLSTQDRAGLEAQLNDLQTQMRTKEQQAIYERKKAEAEYASKLEETNGQLNFYKGQFETTTRDNAILTAATQHDAFNPELFIDVLSPRTEIVKETNESGEETGRLVPRVKVAVKADDGTVAEVYKTPAEAIEIMKGQPEKFGGLFKSNVAKGIGEGSNSTFAGSTKVDVAKMTTEEYMANREAIAKQYNLKTPKNGL